MMVVVESGHCMCVWFVVMLMVYGLVVDVNAGMVVLFHPILFQGNSLCPMAKPSSKVKLG